MLNYSQLIQGSNAFVENEKRDAMHKVATHIIDEYWGKTEDIADGLGVLLLTWNQAFYRYGGFDFDTLDSCLSKNRDLLNQYRNRDIFSYSRMDNEAISKLFSELLEALKNEKGKSPVAAAKALHLLAPKFFPLWDIEIARSYRCLWNHSSEAPIKYLTLMRLTQQQIEDIAKSYNERNHTRVENKQEAIDNICRDLSKNLPFQKSILKVIDEYNYAKYTKKWV